MFIELKKKYFDIKFGEAVIRFRFDNRAFMEIERSGFNPFDIRSVNENGGAARAFITAGLRDYAEKLKLGEDCLNKLVNALLSQKDGKVMLTVTAAILGALPDAVNGPEQKRASGHHIESIYTAFCDIMHRSDEEFWHSTLREVADRWDRYAVMKGYKEAPIQIQRYDDE